MFETHDIGQTSGSHERYLVPIIIIVIISSSSNNNNKTRSSATAELARDADDVDFSVDDVHT